MMIQQLKRFVKVKLLQPYWNFKGSFTYCGQQIFFPRDCAIFRRTIESGIFELDNLQVMTALIKPNTEVLDVGANIGIMLAPLLKTFDNITLVAFEPSPNNLPYLSKTHKYSPHKNRWTIIDKAAFDHVGKVTFQLASEKNGAYDSIYDNKRIDFEREVEVESTTIDTVWNNRNNPDVSFIKIDIEGADLLALRGGINCINECKPFILIEWNQMNIFAFKLTNNHLWEFTSNLNYSIYSLSSSTFSFASLNKMTDFKMFDLFCNFTENYLLIYNG
jgi:FkbM family methyltransferase